MDVDPHDRFAIAVSADLRKSSHIWKIDLNEEAAPILLVTVPSKLISLAIAANKVIFCDDQGRLWDCETSESGHMRKIGQIDYATKSLACTDDTEIILTGSAHGISVWTNGTELTLASYVATEGLRAIKIARMQTESGQNVVVTASTSQGLTKWLLYSGEAGLKSQSDHAPKFGPWPV